MYLFAVRTVKGKKAPSKATAAPTEKPERVPIKDRKRKGANEPSEPVPKRKGKKKAKEPEPDEEEQSAAPPKKRSKKNKK